MERNRTEKNGKEGGIERKRTERKEE